MQFRAGGASGTGSATGPWAAMGVLQWAFARAHLAPSQPGHPVGLRHTRRLEDPINGVGLELAEEVETSKVFPVSNSSRDVSPGCSLAARGFDAESC